MRIHSLEHVFFEGLGSIEEYVLQAGYTLSRTRLYQNTNLPQLHEFDWLIVMGGPMGVGDEAQYPWLRAEKQFIEQAIRAKKLILGICLGAQLIAEVLGAQVRKNLYREIGWFPIERTQQAIELGFGTVLPKTLMALHWHGETFDLPKGAVALASSQACLNQGFWMDGHILGLQCHLEMTEVSLGALLEQCADELQAGKFIQGTSEMLAVPTRFIQANQVMSGILSYITSS